MPRRSAARKTKGPSKKGPSLSPQQRGAITRRARAEGKDPKRVLAGIKAAATRAATKKKYHDRAVKAAATRKLNKAKKTTGRFKTKKGRPLNIKRGKATAYVPRSVRGEAVRGVIRFDFRGLSGDQHAEMMEKLDAEADRLIGRYAYVAIRLLIGMTPLAAMRKIQSPKKHGKRSIEQQISTDDTSPIIVWTPFEKIESVGDMADLMNNTLAPEEIQLEAGEHTELLIAELTWSNRK